MKQSYKTRCENLEKVVRLTFWMARRYAYKGPDYVVNGLDKAYSILLNLNIEVHPDYSLPRSRFNELLKYKTQDK